MTVDAAFQKALVKIRVSAADTAQDALQKRCVYLDVSLPTSLRAFFLPRQQTNKSRRWQRWGDC